MQSQDYPFLSWGLRFCLQTYLTCIRPYFYNVKSTSVLKIFLQPGITFNTTEKMLEYCHIESGSNISKPLLLPNDFSDGCSFSQNLLCECPLCR
jgi:hypothetical protein